MVSRYLVLAGFSGAILITAGAHAEGENAPPRNFAIAGVAATPEYFGSEDFQATPFLGGRVYWDKRYLEITGPGARLNLLNSERFALGPAASYRFGRDDVENDAVDALSDVDDSIELGGFASAAWPISEDGRTRLFAGAEIMFDVSDGHEGVRGELSAGAARALTPRFNLSGEVYVAAVDDNFSGAFFSVSDADAAASGLDAFDASGGFNEVGARLRARYLVTNYWFLSGFASYGRLIGDAADSPIVDEEGDANQVSVGVGVGRAF
ncbi:MAG: MipA/OmpV family protein [Rhodobacteraceae bacterium]|nr:MipA/OmpV family protein [Paracoccaceae bacterium]